jgi:vacuolar-type H+-ATPase subunit E/Vma4
MTERKPIRSEEELAEAFDQLFDEIPSPHSREEIDEYIREAGIDPDSFGAQIKEIASKALRESPLNWRNHAQEEIEQTRAHLEKCERITNRDRGDLLSLIDKVMEKIGKSYPRLAPVHYRNRSELSNDDLVSLLQELMFIAERSNIEIRIDKS